MSEGFVAKNGAVAPLAIEALEEDLDAAGGPEDAYARATLRHLIEIATGPRIELVGFPRISAELVHSGPDPSTLTALGTQTDGFAVGRSRLGRLHRL